MSKIIDVMRDANTHEMLYQVSDGEGNLKWVNADLEEFKKLEIILTKTQKMIDQNLLKRYEKNDSTLTRKDIAYIKRMIGDNRRNNATLRSRLYPS